MKTQINIGITEDHDIVRDGLVALLKEYVAIKVIFEAKDGQELLERLKTTKPDIILLDIEMPVMNGSEALAKIKQKYPKLKIIVLSAFFQDSYVIEYFKKGINCFLPKNCKIDTLVEAIETVYEKGSYFDHKVADLLAKQVAEQSAYQHKALKKDSPLSEQEITIIRLICEYKTSKEIADYFSLSQKTIDFHRSKIMRKTQSKNIAALVEYAIRNKIVKVLK